MTDAGWMERALALAEKGRYSTSPNPMVGCVVTRDGALLGEGFHEKSGNPHAEVEALRAAGDARGATVYVNLEPCCHTGRTGPCTEALIAAGVRRVVVGCEDPHDVVAGKGIARLREAGIEVEVGLLRDRAERLNEKFLHAVRAKRPFVLIKAGMTLDGKLATVARASRWITSEASRERSLALREEYDAVLAGSGTIVEDDPRLTRRLGWNRTPWLRVVVDASGRIPPRARVLSDGEPTLLFTAKPEAYAASAALEIVRAEADGGRIDLEQVLDDLGRRGVRSLIAEGGSLVHTELIRRRLWQKMALFVAPIVVGGATAPSIFGDPGIERLADALRFRFDAHESVGPDLLITAYPND